jgi:hypothetical protein
LAVAEVAERTRAELLRQAESDLARRERAVAEAAENVVVPHAAELTGEYLDRRRELGKLRAQLLGIQNFTRPIDHREARRAAHAELAPVREDVAETRAEAEAADRRIAGAGAAAANRRAGQTQGYRGTTACSLLVHGFSAPRGSASRRELSDRGSQA